MSNSFGSPTFGNNSPHYLSEIIGRSSYGICDSDFWFDHVGLSSSIDIDVFTIALASIV
jgi:hypothetical protein